MTQTTQLSEYQPIDRLRIYNELTRGTRHLFSKGQFQPQVFQHYAEVLMPLVENDPIFLAKLATYLCENSNSKDLKVMAVYMNSLSIANGQPFFPGATINKPNLRLISALLLQKLDPFLASRTIKLAATHKWPKSGTIPATHFPRVLETAAKKYLGYRENRPDMVRGALKAGMKRSFIDLYRFTHLSPSDTVADILRWKQKESDAGRTVAFSFSGMTDLEVAQYIVERKLSVPYALGLLDRKVSPVIGVSLLQQATPNQVIILRSMFDELGITNHPELLKILGEKASKATSGIDRIERIKTQASSETQRALEEARAISRKETLNKFKIGKVCLRVDCSGSMERAIEVAKNYAATIAEMVPDPTTNFMWGRFDLKFQRFPHPQKFIKEGFHQVLFGVRADGGGTDVLCGWQNARGFGADVDIIITDGQDTKGNLAARISALSGRPSAIVIIPVDGSSRYMPHFATYLRAAGIPTVEIPPSELRSAAGVAEAIGNAMVGDLGIIQRIMATEYPEIPSWYGAVSY